MRRPFLVLLALPLVAAASAPIRPEEELTEVSLERARAEARTAEAKTRRLEQAAARARGTAEQLRARQAVAAEDLVVAEARISIAEAERRLIAARLALAQRRLEQQQQPVRSLLGGLALMARRPPLLAIVDRGSVEDFVRIRLLLDSTVPVIRRRTQALSAELRQAQQLEASAFAAQARLVRARNGLASSKQAFAALEQEALRSAAASGGAALETGDVALARGEDVERLSEEANRSQAAGAIARELAVLGPPAPGPTVRRQTSSLGLMYQLPASAPVVDGLGEVNASGVRSRGLTLATARGVAVTAPASGIVRFAGPFRDYDGIVIIDHGQGWKSLIINVASPLRQGARVKAGDQLGRALGRIGVELSRYGQHLSPAIIAGSSRTLSNKAKGG